jgi:hypothetical protein
MADGTPSGTDSLGPGAECLGDTVKVSVFKAAGIVPALPPYAIYSGNSTNTPLKVGGGGGVECITGQYGVLAGSWARENGLRTVLDSVHAGYAPFFVLGKYYAMTEK